jgi:hypothetical protein
MNVSQLNNTSDIAQAVFHAEWCAFCAMRTVVMLSDTSLSVVAPLLSSYIIKFKPLGSLVSQKMRHSHLNQLSLVTSLYQQLFKEVVVVFCLSWSPV